MNEKIKLPPTQTYESQFATVKTEKYAHKAYIKHIKANAEKEINQAKFERKNELKAKKKELHAYQGTYTRCLDFLWRHTVYRLGEDWIFLAFLGTSMALISFGIDKLILLFSSGRSFLYKSANGMAARYFAWIGLPFFLILFDTGFVYLVGPQSAGSGLPEMKTILRGVILPEFLTFRVLVAKIIGLSCTIGAGMPLGKEGPLVHMSSIVTNLYDKFISKIRKLETDSLRKTEMLAAAVAVGVATTFGAPVGGVLFSVEVTTAYFAVRNYFRGFFAAVCGALMYRLLSVWIDGTKTLTPVFKTNFFVDLPFDPQELIMFAFMGIFCGFVGAFYIWCHRQYVLFTKTNIFIKWINNFCRFIYPGFVVLVVSSITFPPGIGRYLAGNLPPKIQVTNLFSNFSWMKANMTPQEMSILDNWRTPQTGPHLHLLSFMAYMFLISIFASTLPVPNGTFIPVFRFGAAFGRIIGELMLEWYPDGFFYGGRMVHAIPGGYATVGAAAFTGSVTQTISVAVIVFEMTGQISHIIPIMVAVLIANAISNKLGPSCYNSVIMIKKLPYLPDLLPSVAAIYDVKVEDFMLKDVKYVHFEMTYLELQNLLKENKKLRNFPLVENEQTMILLGSIKRKDLVEIIENQVGRKRRFQCIFETIRASQETVEIKNKDYDDNKDNRFSHYENVNENNYQTDGAEMQKTEISDNEPLVGTPTEKIPKIKKFRMFLRKKPQKDEIFTSKGREVYMLREPVRDMSMEEKRKWEETQMHHLLDLSGCHIDPAPFQLVEKTSLIKAHYLFSMMGISRAYVTSTGQLVGVVSLKELRKAIEDVNSGNLNPTTKPTDYDTKIAIKSRNLGVII